MAELLQEEKDRIVLEEQFRALVKAELDSQKPRNSMTAWEFLNSSLGLLLLSSVVISGIGSKFTRLKNEHERTLAQEVKDLEQQKRVERINDEIGYRSSVLLVFLDVASEDPTVSVPQGKLAEGHDEAEIKEALGRFITGRSPSVPTLYAEFGNSSVLQLATELRRSEPRDKVTPLGKVIAAMSAVDLLPQATYSNPLQVASTIQEELDQYPAWRQGDFFFTDCNPKVPFACDDK